MKTENTIQSKQKFFAKYWGQPRMYYLANSLNGMSPGYNLVGWMISTDIISTSHLILTPLSKISDEDINAISGILDFHDGNGLIVERVSRGDKLNVEIRAYDRYNDYPNSIDTLKLFTDEVEFFSIDEAGGVYDYCCNRILNVMDYLRSKGYAVPWLDLSVDDLIEYGWVKLKD